MQLLLLLFLLPLGRGGAGRGSKRTAQGGPPVAAIGSGAIQRQGGREVPCPLAPSLDAASTPPRPQAVDEVNWSRVYGGVHFRHAVEQGAALGAAVAEATLEQLDGAAWGLGLITCAALLPAATAAVAAEA